MDRIVNERPGQETQEVWKGEEELDKDAVLSPILFSVDSKYFTKKALERFGDFRIGGKEIHAVKYAEDLVRLVKKGTLL
jgi:hypothetical protein